MRSGAQAKPRRAGGQESLPRRWSVGVGGQGGLEYEEGLQEGQINQGETPAVPVKGKEGRKGREE